MAKYPELEGVPSQCLSTSPLTVDPIKIRAPYGSTDKAEVDQPGIISIDWPNIEGKSAWDLFTSFWQGKDQDAVRGIGWETGAELDAGQRILNLSQALINNKATYESKAREKIVSLAQESKNQLKFISDRYAYWDGIGKAGKANVGIVKLSLKYSNEDILKYLKDDPGEIWKAQRNDARNQIRSAWDKALRLLWCSVYGANQSKVYLKNQELATGVGSTLVAGKILPKRAVKKVALIPASTEPGFLPGATTEPEPETEPVPTEEKPKEKKKGIGLLVAGAAVVALFAMRK